MVSGSRGLGILTCLSAEEERAIWSARLASQTPAERVRTARENWLYIGAYGYDPQTGKSLKRTMGSGSF